MALRIARMRGLRNLAIILAAAAVIAFVPGGGNASATIQAALNMAILSGMAFAVFSFARKNQMTLSALAESSRMLLYGGLGLIVLLIAGQDEMWRGGAGLQLTWLILLGIAIAAIWRVWVEATTYQ